MRIVECARPWLTSCDVHSSTSAGVQRHGYSLVNATKRRTENPRFSTVVAFNSRERCWVAQPSSIASITASSGCRNDTPSANSCLAEPGNSTTAT